MVIGLCFCYQLLHRVIVEAEDGGHASGHLGACLCHSLCPPSHQSQPVAEFQRTGGRQGSEFSQAVARYTRNVPGRAVEASHKMLPQSNGCRVDSGLSVDGFIQLLGRPLVTERRK